MTVYVLAQITIHERARYDGYAAAFMPTLMEYGGRLLAADEAPQVVEGTWDRQKAILMAFKDADHFRRWAESPEYQAIVGDRLASSDGVVLLLNGVDQGRAGDP